MKKLFSLLFIAAMLAIFFIAPQISIASSSTCTVKFHFDGLQVIAFGNPTKASVGILDVHHHTPNIKISKTINNKTSIFREITSKQLINKAINISVPNSPLSPTRHITSNPNRDLTDFSWCLDLEKDLFQKQLYLRDDKLFSKIHFSNGAFNFYSASVSSGKYQFYSNAQKHSFNREIGTPAARLELQPNNVLLIAGMGENVTLPYQAGVSYQVDITNLPPKDMMNIDHFAYYYDVFGTPVERFMPIEAKKVAYRPAPFLCEAVILSRSAIN